MSVDFLRFFVFAFPAYKTQNVCVYFPNPTEMFENAVHIHFAKIHNFNQKIIVLHTNISKLFAITDLPKKKCILFASSDSLEISYHNKSKISKRFTFVTISAL